ncbi:hypothetical protein H4R19_002805 [Coemansia spiralis]|nr:hypothetical protein H4R19_002805 [Coemansia spiralis]
MSEHQQQQQQMGKRARLVAVLRRMLGRRAQAADGMSADARMNLAMAIAAQYVMVSQEYPMGDGGSQCGDAQTLTSPGCAARAVELKGAAGPSLLARFIRRPRTASAGSNTICGDCCCCCDSFASPSAQATLTAAHRELPLCC